MYQRQPYSFPGISNTHNGVRPNLKDKENIPMNPQALHRTHNISTNSDALKDISSLNMNSYHVPYPSKQREKRDNSIQGRLRECISAGVPRRKASFDTKPKGPEDRKVEVSLLEIDKDGAITQREVREEKEILINEFKSIGEKLKKMRDHERKSHTRGNSLSRTDRHLEENYRRHGVQEKESSPTFHTEILCKLDELNQKYQKLARNITSYPHSHAEERTSYNTRSTVKDTETTRSHNFNNTTHMRMMNNPEYRTYRNETKRTFPEASTEGDFDSAREDFEREKAEFFRRKMEAETELKAQHEEFEVKKKHLLDLEVELTKREAEIDQRTRVLELNEKEFEQLTERLEKQSEELTSQKMEYNKKVEAFHSRVEAFEREKEEFGKIENEFSLKNIELRSDQEQLKAYQDKLRVEHELLEERCRNLMNEYDEFNKRKRMLDQREEDVKMTEDDLQGKVEKYQEEIEALNIEREEFIKLVDIAERRLKEREEELCERETSLDLRKEKYDDFDLKLLGMRLNEEVWQKKRDIEVGALQVEISKIREKEKELKRREEKLKKIEGGFDRVENGERSTMGTHTEGSGNMPMSSRTYKTDTEGRDTVENLP